MQQNKKKASSLGWLFLIIIVVYLFASIGINLLEIKNLTIPVNLSLVISELLVLIPGIIYVLIHNLDLREGLGFKPIKAGTIFIALALTIFVSPIASFVNVLTQFFVPNILTSESEVLLSGNKLILLFLSGFYGPFCEEFVFRGIFHRQMGKITSPLRAALMSSLFFGLMHLNLNQACYAFVLGFIFAIVNTASGSIYTSMIIHTAINTFNMLMMIIMNVLLSGSESSLSEATEAARDSNTLFYTAGVLLIFAVIGALISIPIICFMAKHEGHYDDLLAIFTRRKSFPENSSGMINSSITDASRNNNESGKESSSLFNLPNILSIVICIIIIFALEPLLKMLGLK